MAVVPDMNILTADDDPGIFPDPLPADPMPLLRTWFDEARAAANTPNPDAMVLSTIEAGEPAARVVLCKDLNIARGYLVFYTNYESHKAHQLAANPAAAATFHWDHAGRQARVSGVVVRSPAQESDAYFATRPVLSQLGAWASRQSQPLPSREELIMQVAATMMRFGIDFEQISPPAQVATPPVSASPEQPSTPEAESKASPTIPRPPHWGGYRLWIRSVELWSGGVGRLHERVLWKRELSMGDGEPAATPQNQGVPAAALWQSTRLQP
jgi:pyridoxamine 5'-phosphate oxidase